MFNMVRHETIRYLSSFRCISINSSVAYYFEKIPKNDTTRVVRTASKETPDLDRQRTRHELTQNSPRYPILNTK